MRRLFWMFLVAYVLMPGTPAGGQVFDLDLSGVSVAQGERVIGFHVRLQAAKFFSIREFPIGWGLSIDNDASWRTELDALVGVGAAALDADFLDGLISVEKQEFDDLKFAVDVSIWVTKDFDSDREIVLHTPDIVLRAR